MAQQLDYHTIREAFTRFQANEAEPKGELNHTNAYTLVVAVALSAQATDVGVNKATKELFKIADTPQKMLNLGEEGLIEHIKTIGLYRNKAKNVIKLSRILVEEYGGVVPNSRAALESLPGVGRKTANVVMAQAFNQPAFPVDTHIQRLAGRWGLSAAKTPDQTEDDLKKIFPRSSWAKLHLQIIFFGREHCPALYHDLAECQICGWAATKKRMLEEARRNVEIRQRGKKTKTKKAGAKKARATSRTRA